MPFHQLKTTFRSLFETRSYLLLNVFGLAPGLLLSLDFTAMLLIAFVIVTPVAYFIMSGWLESYAYHIKISAWSFAVALLAMLAAAALTVSVRTYRSVTGNPVKVLRED